MTIRLLRADSHREMPWKNGGGTTFEIATWPDAAPLDAFDWRVSVARVEADGPFSRFEGIDRTIAVVQGAGMTLHMAKRGEIAMGAGSPPLAFAGEDDVRATLASGATDDFNVMTRRARAKHRVTRLRLSTEKGEARVAPVGDFLVLLVADGDARVACAGFAASLHTRDALVVTTEPVAVPLVLTSGRASLFVVDVWGGV